MRYMGEKKRSFIFYKQYADWGLEAYSANWKCVGSEDRLESQRLWRQKLEDRGGESGEWGIVLIGWPLSPKSPVSLNWLVQRLLGWCQVVCWWSDGGFPATANLCIDNRNWFGMIVEREVLWHFNSISAKHRVHDYPSHSHGHLICLTSTSVSHRKSTLPARGIL